jgi:hypothetical protein
MREMRNSECGMRNEEKKARREHVQAWLPLSFIPHSALRIPHSEE